MKIGIFGLGYVGLTTAACLLEKQFTVIGYESAAPKREMLSRGICPLTEPGVEPAILSALESGQFVVEAEMTAEDAPDIVFICVGTPGAADGSTDLQAVKNVFQSIAAMVASHSAFATEIVLRSTVPPGTLNKLALDYVDLFSQVPVVFYPEFLRESTAMEDFNHPQLTVIGVVEGSPPANHIQTLLKGFGFDYEQVTATKAESLKFACNAFHAIKVCFANEIGRLVSAHGEDAGEVMRLFCKDTQLNISANYLKPGNPFGGSCLPKDVRSMINVSDQLGLNLELIKASEVSNRTHFDYIVERIISYRPRVITLLGLSFKKNTDDIRESPSVELLYRLASVGTFKIKVHDFLVREATVVGVNAQLVDKLLDRPDFSFHTKVEEALDEAEVIVIMHSDPRYETSAQTTGAVILNVATWEHL